MDHGVSDVRHWLASFQLNEYTQHFVSNGFTNLSKCCFLDERYLQKLQIPESFHGNLLQAAQNLRIRFPDYQNHGRPVANVNDEPPPLPAKQRKNRKSLPSPIPPRRVESKQSTRQSFPPKNSELVPPPAPTRRSHLQSVSNPKPLGNQDAHRENRQTGSIRLGNDLLHRQQPSIKFPPPPSPEQAPSLIFPPPPSRAPPSPETHQLTSTSTVNPNPKLSPLVERKPQTNRKSPSFSEDVMLAMPQDCRNFLIDQPEPAQSAYEDLTLIQPEPSVTPKKPRPKITPRPSVKPRPSHTLPDHRSPGSDHVPPSLPNKNTLQTSLSSVPTKNTPQTSPSYNKNTLQTSLSGLPKKHEVSPYYLDNKNSQTLPSAVRSPLISAADAPDKSSTLPTNRKVDVQAINKVSDIAKRFVETKPDEDVPIRRSNLSPTMRHRKDTVKDMAATIKIPMQMIPSILPENKAMRMIIPHRRKTEPQVPVHVRRKRVDTGPDVSSDDTLDDSGDEENREHLINVPALDGLSGFPEHRTIPIISPKSPLLKQDSSQKLRVFSDNEFKERDKKWETKRGWLWKQGGRRNNKGWKKRWFVFDGDKFTYFTSNKSNSESLSCIALSNFIEVKITQAENARQKYPFELITKHREYLLSADTSEDRTLWCSILMRAITQYKPSILDDLLGGEMNNPEKAGILKKQGNSRIKDWKSRYCAVKDGKFCYYESYEAYCIATPINSIYCGTLKAQTADKARFKFAVIVPNRTYYFIASSEIEMMSWIDTLTNAVSVALTDIQNTVGSTAKELINKIYQEPSNAYCADCHTADPKWASINLGIVVCNKCSGSHRKLGVHISKVRSLELDVKAWTEDMISVFHQIGNARANDYFEKNLDINSNIRPLPDSELKVREGFIEEKYTNGRWSDTIKHPPEEMNKHLLEVVQTNELHKTLALLMSGAYVNYVEETEEEHRKTPYLMAVHCNQKAQAQLLLLNDAVPVLQDESDEVAANVDGVVDLQGTLEKKGPSSLQSYKKRKCILSGKHLRYFDDGSLKNELDLRTMTEVEIADRENPNDETSSEGYQYLRIRTGTRTYMFRDRDRDYLNTWYEAIRNTQVFGTVLDSQPKTANGIPVLLHKCIKFLDSRLDTEGIYRISGVKTRIEKLKLAFNQDVQDVVLGEEMVTHDVTSLVKQYLRELPSSLLGHWNKQLTAAVQIDDETERLYRIQDIIYELPGTEFHTLKFIMQHLYRIVEFAGVNKMNSENLGVVFGPTLMSTFEVGNDFNPYEYQVITAIIDYFGWLFQVDIETEEHKKREIELAEEELKKRMNQLDAPQSKASDSWIVEVLHQQKSVNVRIESGQTLRDISAEILFRTKIITGDYALYEFLCDGQLQRPIHLSEYLLNTTVTLWEIRVHKAWLEINFNDMTEKLKTFNFEPPQSKSIEQGTLSVLDGKKKWREVQCRVLNDTFTYPKSKLNPTNLNLLNYTWYVGCEAALSPPTRYSFTLRCISPPKDHKDDIFKCFCASDEAELWRWLFRINYVKYKEPDYRLVNSKRATLQNPNHRNSFLLLDK